MKKIVLLTALAIAGFAVTTSAQTVPSYLPTNGLVGWWPFNGNAIDESINTNDGTVNGATLTTDRFGSANSAYSFDGLNNQINVPSSSSLTNFSNGQTLSLWIKITSYPTDSKEHYMITKDQLGGAYAFYQVCISDFTNANEIFYRYGQSPSSSQGSHLPFSNVPLNQWFNLCYTTDLTVTKTYINGTLFQTYNLYSPIGVTSSPLIFGNTSSVNTTNAPYKGALDDIGIWNRALTQQEITGLYNGNICYQTITVTDTLLINTNITGFNPVTYQNTIKIWPNPTNDHITIDNGNLANLTGYQLKISNALGQQVFQSAITQQQFYVDMSTWGGNGIYFVNLINAQGVTIETRKIVLQ